CVLATNATLPTRQRCFSLSLCDLKHTSSIPSNRRQHPSRKIPDAPACASAPEHPTTRSEWFPPPLCRGPPRFVKFSTPIGCHHRQSTLQLEIPARPFATRSPCWFPPPCCGPSCFCQHWPPSPIHSPTGELCSFPQRPFADVN